MKPLYDFYCGSNTYQEVKEVFKFLFSKNNIVEGEYIEKFEDRIANITNSKYAISYATGRHALYSILKALGIGKGDEVILQAFTCVVVPNAILYVGATPIYVDVNKNTFNMSLRSLESRITSKTKAVIVQHTFGEYCNIRKVREVTKNIPIIEDCAHTIKILECDAGFISTDHTKVISTSTGGVALINREDIKIERAKQLSKFRTWQIAFTFMVEVLITHPKFYRIGRYIRGILNKTRVFYFFRDENKKKKPKNYPSALSNIQCFIGCMQLDKLDDNLKHRRSLSFGSKYDLLRRSISVGDSQFYKRVGDFIIGVWFNSPVFGAKNLEQVKYKKGSCPIAEYLSRHIMNFPTHQRSIRG